MGEKKYELIPSDIEGLFRIKALRDFSDVKKDEIGGYVSGEYNLSHNGDCWIYGEAIVCDNSCVCDNAIVSGNAKVYDNADVFGNAIVGGNALVNGYAEICGNTVIKDMGDYIVFQNAWSSGRYFTWTRSNNMWKVGCFYGTGEELINKAYKDSEESGREYERIVKYVEETTKK